MAIFLILCLFVLLALHWITARERLEQLELSLGELKRRVHTLESAHVITAGVGEPAPHSQPAKSVATAPSRPPVATSIPSPAPTPTPAAAAAPEPDLGRRLRNALGDAEWETIVGGNLLNKMGALVLVIGIALFLSYSFTHLTPPGRAVISLTGSLALLATGGFLERRPAYRIFSAGLLGAGWAALYGTAYAIYAVPAARLITNPYVGSILLLLVATAMIGHSLRYRLQAMTAVAYFAAYAALAVTPSSLLAVASVLPLAGSVLYLARRFRWNALPLLGLLATYGVALVRGDAGASFALGQLLLLSYWLLFEAFDLMRPRSGVLMLDLLFPLNALAFLPLSYRLWLTPAAPALPYGYAFAAALYLASAIARYFLRPASPNNHLLARMQAGTAEAPVALSAVLAALAIVARTTGLWLSAGFAVEAAILYTAGVFLNLSFLRWLGNAAFAVSLWRLAVAELLAGLPLAPANLRAVQPTTPLALFHALLFYGNRLLRKPNAAYSSLAATLVALVLAQQLPLHAIGLAWIVLALILFEVGLLRNILEFRLQAYLLASASIVLCLGQRLCTAWPHSALLFAALLAFVYAFPLQARLRRAHLPPTEQTLLETGSSIALTLLALFLTWDLTPLHYRGVAWSVLALALRELGQRHLPRPLVRCAGGVAAAASALVLFENAAGFTRPCPVFTWLSCLALALSLAVFSYRTRNVERVAAIVSASASLAFLFTALWLLLPPTVIAPAWAALALVMFLVSLRYASPAAQVQSFVAMGLALGNAGAAGFEPLTVSIAVACYAAHLLAPSGSRPRIVWSLAGTLTLTCWLFAQSSGDLLTSAWGLEGLALLAAGFPLRQRIMRWQGLTLLLLCIGKLFLYDLRNLETLYRILSFVLLGAILLVVSWLYTRYRDRVNRYL